MPLQKPSLRLRVEEEYPIIDRASGELLGYLNQFPDRNPLVFYQEDVEKKLRPPLQSVTELLHSDSHPDLPSLAAAVKKQRGQVAAYLQQHGCRMAIAGTHVDSKPHKQTRVFSWYSDLVGQVGVVARRMQIFATTFAVGIEEPELALEVMNGIRYLLPHVLCLSTSSPFWSGEATGLKSYRQVIRDSLLRTNLPPYFEGIGQYQEYLDTVIQTNCIQKPSDIRWDVRLDMERQELIVSMCDAVTRFTDLVAIAGLLQAVVAWLSDLRLRNMHFRTYDRLLLMENKWRAIRYGTQGRLIDFGKEQEIPLLRLTWELIGLVQPYADALGTLPQIEHAFTIVEEGASADGQLRVWEESGQDIGAVINHIAEVSEEHA